MSAAVTIMQKTTWNKFSIEDWFRQFGAWMNGDTETVRLMLKTMPTKKLTQAQREDLIAQYMGDDSIRERVQRKGIVCQITDNEARAVQRMILDIRAMDSDILQDWMNVLWTHYVMGSSLRDVATIYETSLLQVRQDIKCGLAFICGRYPNLQADLLKKAA